VLVNLVGNAVKFTREGEVIVRVTRANGPDGRVRMRVAVTDTGVGLSKEQLSTLFKPFTQVDSTSTREFGGTGLGLVISKQIAELLGGDITVESAIGAGSTFTFTFEAAPDVPVSGDVLRIDPALVSVDGSPAVQAWASLDTPDGVLTLASGLTAEVEIVAGEARDALLVPVQALRELTPGSYAVFVVQADGELKLTPVTVGLKDFANAEILSGLQAGDVVSTGTIETK
jgi:hypothetical protein